jgi:hypothetical protein
MKRALAFPILVLCAAAGRAGPEEAAPPGGGAETTFTLEEIENYLSSFNAVYKDKKQPEEDATGLLENMLKAYRFLDGKEKQGQATTDDMKMKKRIVVETMKGLKVRNRTYVTLECVKKLGEMGDRSAAKEILGWLDKIVLDAKNPQPPWVESGFLALALIGEDDDATVKFIISYATGKHPDETLPNLIITQLPEWRSLSGKNRKELFERILGYVGGLHSTSKKGGSEGATAKERYERLQESARRFFTEFAGASTPFADPPAVNEWFKENKKKNWEDYVGVRFRKKAEQPKPEGGAPSDEGAKKENPG